MSLKIATWNVNSIRIRIDGLKNLIDKVNPDIVCIQEVKAKESDFPSEEIKNLGYGHIALNSMAGYNGVAILSKLPLKNIEAHSWCGKADARHIKADVGDIEINNIYIPAGGDIPDININPSFAHKLKFIDELALYFRKNKEKYQNKKLVLCGDFNVAPLENDVWGHKEMQKTVSHTPIEVLKITSLQSSLNLINVIRKIYPEPQKVYSWWSYRNPNWKTNDKGRLLDHIWVTQALNDYIESVTILKEQRTSERPSDHVPIILKIR
ncbi:MAG: exodeoxyribonuclease III [Lactobacillaceae bacterium]|jgi:exodeoxyribonuclease-3|nr:exodeoxyribonuclease III [Lactobacillaceae bacterium]